MRVVAWPTLGKEEIEARLSAIQGIEFVSTTGKAELLAALPDAEVLMMMTPSYDEDIAAAVERNAPNLRWIQLFSAGYDRLQRHGVRRGVTVSNASEGWAVGVAEHAITMLFALVKCLPAAHDNQRRAVWQRDFSSRMGSLDGMTVAIVGFGAIGKAVAHRARGFGMRIIGVSRGARPDAAADEVHPIAELHCVLAEADAVIVAAPLTPETHHMFDEAAFAAMKPGAYLVNIARGPLVDPKALSDALHSGRLAGAGIDVTEPEPLQDGDPLWHAPNLIVTPHVAGACGPRGRERLADFVAGNVARYAAGKKVTNIVEI